MKRENECCILKHLRTSNAFTQNFVRKSFEPECSCRAVFKCPNVLIIAP